MKKQNNLFPFSNAFCFYFITILATYFCVVGCGIKTKQITGSIEVSELKEKLRSTQDFVLLDVRTPEEVSEGTIDQRAVHMDYLADGFSNQVSTLDRKMPYYVYCRAGGRSSQAVDKMKELGFSELYNVEGGITAWQEAGFPFGK